MNVELKKDSCIHHSSFISGRTEKEQTKKREKLTKVKNKNYEQNITNKV